MSSTHVKRPHGGANRVGAAAAAHFNDDDDFVVPNKSGAKARKTGKPRPVAPCIEAAAPQLAQQLPTVAPGSDDGQKPDAAMEAGIPCPVCGLGLGLWPTLQARSLHVDACLTRAKDAASWGEAQPQQPAVTHCQTPPPAILDDKAPVVPAVAVQPGVHDAQAAVGGPSEAAPVQQHELPVTVLEGDAGRPIDLCGADETDTDGDAGQRGAQHEDGDVNLPPPCGVVGHVSGLVCESPGAWLSTNSVAPPHVADVLRSAEVSLAELPYITDEDLIGMGITELEDRRRLLAKVALLLPAPPHAIRRSAVPKTGVVPMSHAIALAQSEMLAPSTHVPPLTPPAEWMPPAVPPLPPAKLISRTAAISAAPSPPPVRCSEQAALAAVSTAHDGGGCDNDAGSDFEPRPTPPLAPSATAEAHGAGTGIAPLWRAHHMPGSMMIGQEEERRVGHAEEQPPATRTQPRAQEIVDEGAERRAAVSAALASIRQGIEVLVAEGVTLPEGAAAAILAAAAAACAGTHVDG